METKRCRVCLKEKKVSLMTWETRNGVRRARTLCRECHITRCRDWREKNLQKSRSSARERKMKSPLCARCGKQRRLSPEEWQVRHPDLPRVWKTLCPVCTREKLDAAQAEKEEEERQRQESARRRAEAEAEFMKGAEYRPWDGSFFLEVVPESERARILKEGCPCTSVDMSDGELKDWLAGIVDKFLSSDVPQAARARALVRVLGMLETRLQDQRKKFSSLYDQNLFGYAVVCSGGESIGKGCWLWFRNDYEMIYGDVWNWSDPVKRETAFREALAWLDWKYPRAEHVGLLRVRAFGRKLRREGCYDLEKFLISTGRSLREFEEILLHSPLLLDVYDRLNATRKHYCLKVAAERDRRAYIRRQLTGPSRQADEYFQSLVLLNGKAAVAVGNLD